MTKPVVIYHSADFDGLFCREIARLRFGEVCEYIGWDYGEPEPIVPHHVTLYMLDISVPGLMDHPLLQWVDHHKSAMERYGRKAGYQIDGVAACRLTWQYLYGAHSYPPREAFVNRTVNEPVAVRLAGEYDVWDKRDPAAELFQHGLRSCDLERLWPKLLQISLAKLWPEVVTDLLERGRAVQYAKAEENKGIITSYGFDLEWEGLKFLACNHARFNSHLFTAGIKLEHDALFGFNWDGKMWRISLYHAPGKEHYDLSQIAVRYGGGGHRGACGFKVDRLPFPVGG